MTATNLLLVRPTLVVVMVLVAATFPVEAETATIDNSTTTISMNCTSNNNMPPFSVHVPPQQGDTTNASSTRSVTLSLSGCDGWRHTSILVNLSTILCDRNDEEATGGSISNSITKVVLANNTLLNSTMWIVGGASCSARQGPLVEVLVQNTTFTNSTLIVLEAALSPTTVRITITDNDFETVGGNPSNTDGWETLYHHHHSSVVGLSTSAKELLSSEQFVWGIGVLGSNITGDRSVTTTTTTTDHGQLPLPLLQIATNTMMLDGGELRDHSLPVHGMYFHDVMMAEKAVLHIDTNTINSEGYTGAKGITLTGAVSLRSESVLNFSQCNISSGWSNFLYALEIVDATVSVESGAQFTVESSYFSARYPSLRSSNPLSLNAAGVMIHNTSLNVSGTVSAFVIRSTEIVAQTLRIGSFCSGIFVSDTSQLMISDHGLVRLHDLRITTQAKDNSIGIRLSPLSMRVQRRGILSITNNNISVDSEGNYQVPPRGLVVEPTTEMLLDAGGTLHIGENTIAASSDRQSVFSVCFAPPADFVLRDASTSVKVVDNSISAVGTSLTSTASVVGLLMEFEGSNNRIENGSKMIISGGQVTAKTDSTVVAVAGIMLTKVTAATNATVTVADTESAMQLTGISMLIVAQDASLSTFAFGVHVKHLTVAVKDNATATLCSDCVLCVESHLVHTSGLHSQGAAVQIESSTLSATNRSAIDIASSVWNVSLVRGTYGIGLRFHKGKLILAGKSTFSVTNVSSMMDALTYGSSMLFDGSTSNQQSEAWLLLEEGSQMIVSRSIAKVRKGSLLSCLDGCRFRVWSGSSVELSQNQINVHLGTSAVAGLFFDLTPEVNISGGSSALVQDNTFTVNSRAQFSFVYITTVDKVTMDREAKILITRNVGRYEMTAGHTLQSAAVVAVMRTEFYDPVYLSEDSAIEIHQNLLLATMPSQLSLAVFESEPIQFHNSSLSVRDNIVQLSTTSGSVDPSIQLIKAKDMTFDGELVPKEGRTSPERYPASLVLVNNTGVLLDAVRDTYPFFTATRTLKFLGSSAVHFADNHLNTTDPLFEFWRAATLEVSSNVTANVRCSFVYPNNANALNPIVLANVSSYAALNATTVPGVTYIPCEECSLKVDCPSDKAIDVVGNAPSNCNCRYPTTTDTISADVTPSLSLSRSGLTSSPSKTFSGGSGSASRSNSGGSPSATRETPTSSVSLGTSTPSASVSVSRSVGSISPTSSRSLTMSNSVPPTPSGTGNTPSLSSSGGTQTRSGATLSPSSTCSESPTSSPSLPLTPSVTESVTSTRTTSFTTTSSASLSDESTQTMTTEVTQTVFAATDTVTATGATFSSSIEPEPTPTASLTPPPTLTLTKSRSNEPTSSTTLQHPPTHTLKPSATRTLRTRLGMVIPDCQQEPLKMSLTRVNDNSDEKASEGSANATTTSAPSTTWKESVSFQDLTRLDNGVCFLVAITSCHRWSVNMPLDSIATLSFQTSETSPLRNLLFPDTTEGATKYFGHLSSLVAGGRQVQFCLGGRQRLGDDAADRYYPKHDETVSITFETSSARGDGDAPPASTLEDQSLDITVKGRQLSSAGAAAETQKDTQTATATTIAALSLVSGSPGAVGAVQRSQVLSKIVDCPGEELDLDLSSFDQHPLQFSVGTSEFSEAVGCFMGNTALVVLLAIGHVVVGVTAMACATQEGGSSRVEEQVNTAGPMAYDEWGNVLADTSDQSPPDSTIVRLMATVHMPGHIFPIAMFLLQPTLSGVFATLFYAEEHAIFAAATICLLIIIGLTIAFKVAYMTPTTLRASVEFLGMPPHETSWLIRFFQDRGYWKDRDLPNGDGAVRRLAKQKRDRVSRFADRIGAVLKDYRPDGKDFWLVDVLGAMLSAMIVAQKPQTRQECDNVFVVTIVMFSVYAFLSLSVRPFHSICLNAALVFLTWTQLASAVLLFYAFEYDHEPSYKGSVYCNMAANVTGLMMGAYALVMFVVNRVLKSRSKALEEERRMEELYQVGIDAMSCTAPWRNVTTLRRKKKTKSKRNKNTPYMTPAFHHEDANMRMSHIEPHLHEEGEHTTTTTTVNTVTRTELTTYEDQLYDEQSAVDGQEELTEADREQLRAVMNDVYDDRRAEYERDRAHALQVEEARRTASALPEPQQSYYTTTDDLAEVNEGYQDAQQYEQDEYDGPH